MNLAKTPTAEFTTNPDWQFPLVRMEQRIADSCDGSVLFLDAQALALKLMGDAIFANTFLLGVAWQQGAGTGFRGRARQAFELNGTAVDKIGRPSCGGAVPHSTSRPYAVSCRAITSSPCRSRWTP